MLAFNFTRSSKGEVTLTYVLIKSLNAGKFNILFLAGNLELCHYLDYNNIVIPIYSTSYH